MMTPSQARQILVRFRPGLDEQEPDIQEALALARRDPTLGKWWEEQQQMHRALRSKFQDLPVPEDLRGKISTLKPRPSAPVIALRFWLPLAAALALMFFVVRMGERPVVSSENRLENFKARMVRTVLREYQMEIITNDLAAIREFQSQRGAISDYRVTPLLQRLQLTGAGVLRWQNQPVSMVCFDRGNQEMVFLFVVSRSAIPDPPGPEVQTRKVNKLLTAAWSEGDHIYLLAGPPDQALN